MCDLVQLDHRRSTWSFDRTLSAAKSGDDEAWATIYGDLIGPITGYLNTHGVQDSDDLAGEVFLQVARDIHRFEGDESSFRSWVFVIAHRRMIDWRRTMMRRPRMTDAAADYHQTPGGNVEDEAMEVLGLAGVENALTVLTDDQRQVLALRVVADMSLEETARTIGKTVGAVKALQRRALLAVKTEIDEGRVSL